MHENSSKTAEELSRELREGLSTLIRRGSASPSDLIFETPEMLHALRQLGLDDPPPDRPLEVKVTRAMEQVIERLSAADAEVARIMFGLHPSTRRKRLGERRELAAKVLGITAGTFRNRQEARMLDTLAQELAFALMSPVQNPLAQTEGPKFDPTQVLLIHSEDSFGVKEVGRLVESLGLRPLLWRQALDRVGISSPSMTDRFRSCLDIVQAVVIVLEGGSAEARANLAFEAGLALGLAESRTVIVQLGDQDPPRDLGTANILRLRNTTESVAALDAALRRSGCATTASPSRPLSDIGIALNVGWYRWTPDHASNPVYASIAQAIRDFVPVDVPSGHAAAEWLKNEALKQYPSVITYLQVGNGRVEGFIALQAASIRLTSESKPDEIRGATELKWIARHRDSESGEKKLLLFATAVALEAAEKHGSIALLIDPYDEAEAQFWTQKYPFLESFEGDSHPKLWMAISDPSQGPGSERAELAAPLSAT